MPRRSAVSRNCQGCLATAFSMILSSVKGFITDWLIARNTFKTRKGRSNLFYSRRPYAPFKNKVSKGTVATQSPPTDLALPQCPWQPAGRGVFPPYSLCDLLHACKAWVTWVPPGWFMEVWVAHLRRGVGCRNACALTSLWHRLLQLTMCCVVSQSLGKFWIPKANPELS